MASINTFFGYKMQQADTFRLIRRAGFEGVILRWSDSFDDVVCELQPDQARKAGLAVENIHARFRDDNGLWRDNLDGEALTRRLFEFIDDCHRYEIPTMVVHITTAKLRLHSTSWDSRASFVSLKKRNNYNETLRSKTREPRNVSLYF